MGASNNGDGTGLATISDKRLDSRKDLKAKTLATAIMVTDKYGILTRDDNRSMPMYALEEIVEDRPKQ